MKVSQILYSGLGGHGSVVFSMVAASCRGDTTVSHHLIFYGIEDLKPEYLHLCQALHIQPEYVRKANGLDLSGQYSILKHLLAASPAAVLAHSHSCFPAVAVYRLLRPGTTFLYVEHQTNARKSRAHCLASRLAPWLMTRVVYLTRESMEQIKARIGVFFRPGKAEVIPNGIDIDHFRPGKSTLASGIRVGMQSRLTEFQDHETLLRAVALMKVDCQVLIAGDGEARPRLETLSSELGLQTRVAFVGLLSEAELIDFLRALTVYVHSTHGETMSTAIMQAQACGLPVIASDVSGVTNQIRHGEDGWLVSPKDSEALAKALDEMLSDEVRRRRLASAARRKAVESYSHHAMWEGYRRVLQGCTEAGRPLA